VVVLGVAACFYINALSFGAVLFALFLIQIPAVKNSAQKKSALKDIGEGIRYLKADPALIGLLGMSTAFSIFIFPYLSLLSVFAKDEFNSQADGYGILMAGVGVGAVGGALVVARLSETKKRALFLQIGAGTIVVSLLFFSFAPSLWLSLPFLAIAGGGMVALQSSINTIVQTGVPDAMRGRMISMWQLTGMGLLPVGSLLGGTVAQWLGARVAVGGGAVIFGIIAVVVYLFIPSIREN
jgi:predicted MFS family arabinose efflux permease